MPAWVEDAFADYASRMPRESRLELREIPLGRRAGKGGRAVAEEGERMLKALAPDDRVVALEVGGRALDTESLARRFGNRLQDGRDVVFAIGGPDGLAPVVVERAEWRWSLSPLTLPHGLVRVVLAEQLYRATTILAGHPYHRA